MAVSLMVMTSFISFDLQRLELESLQQQPLEGSHVVVPNISMSQGVEEPNEYVKAYLAEQQEALRQQIEAAQQQMYGHLQQPTDLSVQTNNTHAVQQQQEVNVAPVNDIPQVIEQHPEQSAAPVTATNRRRTSSRHSESEDVTPSKRSTRSGSASSRKSETVDNQTASKVEVPVVEQPHYEAPKVEEAVPEKKVEVVEKTPEKKEHKTEVPAEVVQQPKGKYFVVKQSPVYSYIPHTESLKKTTPQKEPQVVVEPAKESPKESKEPEKQESPAKDASKTSSPVKENKEPTKKTSEEQAVETSPVKEAPKSSSPVKESPKKTEEKKPEVQIKKQEEDQHKKPTEPAKKIDDSKTEKKEERSLKRQNSIGQEEKGSRPKRKWGSISDNQRSKGITTSELNDLLPRDEKVSTAGLETSTGDESQGNSVDQVDSNSIPSGKSISSAGLAKKNASLEDVVLKNESSDTFNKKTSLGKENEAEAMDTSTTNGSEEKGQSPPRNPPSNVVFLQNLTRPFTLSGLQGLLKKFGSLDTKKFWIDKIKSKCLVTFASIEEAETARKELHGFRWPDSNPKTLTADFSTEEEIQVRKEADEAPPAPPVVEDKPKKEVIKMTIENENASSKKNIREWDQDKVEKSSAEKKRRSRSPGDRRDSKKERMFSCHVIVRVTLTHFSFS